MKKNQQIWKYALTSTLVSLCVIGFGRMSYGILMPFMKDSLSLTYQQAGLLGTVTAVGYLSLVLFVGIFAAKWGSRKLIIIGTLLVTCGLVYLTWTQTFLSCLVGMVLLGIGAAFTYTPLVNIVVGWYPQQRGMMIGFIISGLGLGSLISSLLIPVFTDWFSTNGWRYLWLLFSFVTLLSSFVSYRILRDPPTVLHKTDQKGHSFVHDVYLNKKVVLVAVIYGLIGFAYLIPQSFLFSFLLDSHINQYSAGHIMSLGSIMSIFSGPLWGTISDKIGRKTSMLITLFLGAVSMIIPIIFPVYLGFVICQFLWGITYVGMLSLIQALSTEQVHQSYAPVALGYVTVYFAVGQFIGPGLGGWFIDYLGGIPSALYLCSGLLLAAFVLSTQLNKKIKGKLLFEKKHHELKESHE
ncbi:YbfB/YjiJ family MFS transporter [Neobacillus rhizophilus]|uniref:YbfB/YjiJ family MFS transporter n=1 Tax=Neobacillus rhizophilus TaxID=2833579 RepID=A0A942U7M1_9BACI|nr:YbfB/YjiJ family MFS transporter [Neobacillus rhizophilus]MBS4216171.1 YbfB/YjiJ family MFS transporter [Neobacillus rhizophilus]